jgi:hypothetical protein
MTYTLAYTLATTDGQALSVWPTPWLLQLAIWPSNSLTSVAYIIASLVHILVSALS